MENLKEIRWKQRFENFEILNVYLPELEKMYDKLSKEL